MPDSTVGQFLVNDALPPELRDYNRTWDKATMQNVLGELARNHPDEYRDRSHRLLQLGWQAAQEKGGLSFGLKSLQTPPEVLAIREKIRQGRRAILDDDTIDDNERQSRITKLLASHMKPQQKAVSDAANKAENPLAQQVTSGSRGNPMNLTSLLGSDMMYEDSQGRTIPLPVLHSFAEGLQPSEYWAGSYGARRGVVATKLATANAGYFGKLLNQVSHRLVVTDHDAPDTEDEDRPIRGMPTTTEDPDNDGALLAHPAGGYPRHTVLSPKILHDLKARGVHDILVRSPIVGGPDSGGVYARDVGVREKGTLPGRGEMVGMQGTQSMSEPLSQGQLSSKHSGGVAGEEKALGGFARIASLVQVPKIFPGGSVHAEDDGPVSSITPGPAGGWHVMIGSQKHYVPQTRKLLVKPGDTLEAGDRLTDGEPSPAEITRLKHIGEGRRYFTAAFSKAMQAGGIKVHRRNVELLAKALINHVKMDDIWGDHLPDEVVPYNLIESNWTPREGHSVVDPRQAVGKYLEMPILHHTIGTKIKPSTVKEMQNFGIKQVTVHDEPPPFRPVMVRGMDSLHHDPDWMARMYGSGLQKSFLDSVHTGGVSDETGTSFVPSLAKGIGFGSDQNAIHASEPGVLPSSPASIPGSKKVSTMPYKTAAESSEGTKSQPSTAGGGANATVDASTSLGGAGSGTMKTPVPAGKGVVPDVDWLSTRPMFMTDRSPRGEPGPDHPSKSPAPAPAPAALPDSPGPTGENQKPDLGWVGTAFGPPAVKMLDQALPGIGGALAVGSSFAPAALGAVMKGPEGRSTFSNPKDQENPVKTPSWVSPHPWTTTPPAVSSPVQAPPKPVDPRPEPPAAEAGPSGSAGPEGQRGEFGNPGQEDLPGMSAEPSQALEMQPYSTLGPRAAMNVATRLGRAGHLSQDGGFLGQLPKFWASGTQVLSHPWSSLANQIGWTNTVGGSGQPNWVTDNPQLSRSRTARPTQPVLQ